VDLGLSGLRALVTGGTRGIGRAIVEGLAAEGAVVGLCARTETGVSATLDALASDGYTAIGRVADVSDEAALRAWVEYCAAELGGIDIVVMMGTVGLVSAALPYLETSNAPSIVTIASVSGREIDFAAGPYGVFKAAIIHYTQGLAYQLAVKGIRANSLSPGNTYFPGGVWPDIEQRDPELFARAKALNPTGRMARPDEIARAAVFLASPAASFITGANLLVDGALTRGVQF
jgi:3-oxoacyl-[acyl-carrier protein] reductase